MVNDQDETRGARLNGRDVERRTRALKATRRLSKVEPQMAALIRAAGPHRLIIHPDPFTTLLGSIVQQQISMTAAAAIRGRLQDLCPRRRFTAKAILAIDEADLRAAGLSRQKAIYVRDLAAHFADGRLRAAKLRKLDDEEVIQATTQVHGIGRWTAEMLLMFCLEREDVWPIDDLGLRKAAQRYLGLADSPKADIMRDFGERWRPYRSYASWYLWRSLEGPLMPGVAL